MSRGDRFFVDKLFYSDSARFDVVVYKWTDSEGTERTFVDRIIGLPGERVEVRDNAALVDGYRLQEPYLRLHGWVGGDFGPAVVPPNSYFLLGDLRDRTRDSRDPAIGFVSRNQIVGLVLTITYSTDPESGDFRWGRIGTLIR